MRRTSLAALTAAAVTGGLLLPTTAARADEPTVFYVRQFSTACSDTGPGTLAQPFCSIAPAAAIVGPGQTVDVGSGTYREHLTIARSGTPEQPIVFRSSSSSNAYLIGATGGITIDGQHDITIQRFQATQATELPALDIRNASGIVIEGGSFSVSAGTQPAVRLSGVTRSTITRAYVTGQALAAGVTLDAATSGVTLSALSLTGATYASLADHSVGIQVAGAGNIVRSNVISGFSGTAIAVETGASGTVVVNNQIAGGPGHGIRNHGAAGTAITNNTVRDRCGDGIRVDGTSSGVSVQNNVLYMNGPFGQTGCEVGVEFGAELQVRDDAVKDTVVDYNNAYHRETTSGTIYGWGGSLTSLSWFRTVSGQAGHDRETGLSRDAIDSANSAAAGYPETDRVGTARADDPGVPNTGAGPVPYADRGALETIRNPVARTSVSLNLADIQVTIDASASEPGFAPIASYRFVFGDGTTVTQTSPVVSHRYAGPGDYGISTTVIGTDGRSGTRAETINVLRRTSTVGLLALGNLRYVDRGTVPTSLTATGTGLGTTGHFDLADAGNGQVALLSRASGKYLGVDLYDTRSVSMTAVSIAEVQKFSLVTNADGSISLRSVVTGRYVSAAPDFSFLLLADKTTIGTTEKFYRVNVADANRSLRALSNKLYVTADSAGTKPLTASRTSASRTEQFDLVDLGNGQVALFAGANNRFVSADGAGAKPLIAIRATVGSWERFTIVRNTDGTVSIKAGANNRYVTALRTNPLIASGSTTGTQQRFLLR
ncbi:right-handed parallel beta-helix repeat-containing protein [Micromonospora sp. NPDC050495]|uniref:right-handed parallel beta-helix repeat-containing protein n=1 Tax=Micromonospora sp. NPDC050495 TaxID=3154936 RepID=UPI0033D5C28F